MSILSKWLHPTIGLCVRTFLNNAFSVQHGLFQGVAVIHQLEGKVGVLFLQQTEKELVPFPDGQFCTSDFCTHCSSPSAQASPLIISPSHRSAVYRWMNSVMLPHTKVSSPRAR